MAKSGPTRKLAPRKRRLLDGGSGEDPLANSAGATDKKGTKVDGASANGSELSYETLEKSNDQIVAGVMAQNFDERMIYLAH